MTSLAVEIEQLEREDRARFGQMIGVSLGLHVFLAVIFAAWKVLLPSAPHIMIPDAIQVDLTAVALPLQPPPSKTDKKTTAPPKKVEPEMTEPKVEKEAPREAKSIAEAMKKDPTPTPKPGLDEAARARLARRLARARMRQRVASLSKADAAENAGSTGASGPGTGAGGSISGSNRDTAWAAALNQRFYEVWVISQLHMNKDLKTVVHLKTDPEGRVHEVTVEKSSNDLGFDKAALRAVRKAQPIPLPTEPELRTYVLKNGFSLGFNPKGLSK